MGLSLPLGLLAAWEYGYWVRRLPWRTQWLLGRVFLILTMATPLGMMVVGARSASAYEYISRGEFDSAQQLLKLGPGHVILASPVRGSALPWLTGQQVVVGHPMETLDADRRIRSALAFYNGQWGIQEQCDFLYEEEVDFVWVGELERALLNGRTLLLPCADVYLAEDAVTVLAVHRPSSGFPPDIREQDAASVRY